MPTPLLNLLSAVLVLLLADTAAAQPANPSPRPPPVAPAKSVEDLLAEFNNAVRSGDGAKVKGLLDQQPELAKRPATGMGTGRTWLHLAAELGHSNVVAVLLAAKVNLNVPSDGPNPAGLRRTPLHLAAAQAHASVVQQLLEAGALVDPLDIRGATPLHIALESLASVGRPERDPEARRETVRLLLRRGAALLAPTVRESSRTSTPLELVLKPDRAPWLDMVLTNAQPPGVRDGQGNTLLHLALTHQRLAAAEELLRRKADHTTTNHAGLTPFQNAIFFGPPQPLDAGARTRTEPPGYWNLLAAGLKPDQFTLTGMGDRAALAGRLTSDKSLARTARDGGGRTLLHWAAAKGYLEMVELLLQHGADPTVVDAQGRLPLHEAAQSGRVEVLHRLASPALAGQEDSSKRTAFELAVHHAQSGAAEWLLRFKPDLTRTSTNSQPLLHLLLLQGNTSLVGQLLVAGASPATTNQQGQTPLHLAAERGNTNALIQLLNARSPVAVRDSAGVTALAAALTARHTEAARLLLDAAPDGRDRAASLDSVDNGGYTPLTRAIARRDRAMAVTLLDWGAAVNGPSNAIATPLSVAMYHGQYAVANMLLERKADLNARDTNGNSALHLSFVRSVSDNAEDASISQHREQVEKQLVPATVTYSEWVRSTNHLALLREYWGIGHTGSDPGPNRSTHHMQPVEHPLKYLLVAGADPNLTNAAGRTPMHLLALRPDIGGQVNSSRLEVIVGLLAARGADLNARDPSGYTPLQLAVLAGVPKVVESMLRQNADVTLSHPKRGGLVALALQHREPFPPVGLLIELLLKHGAPLNGRDTNGQTVLHHLAKFADACQNHGGIWDHSLKDQLLKAQVEVDAQDSEGNTALHYAVRGHLRWLVADLINHGANPLLRNKTGKSPMALSQQYPPNLHPDRRVILRPPGAKVSFDEAVSSVDLESLKAWLTVAPELANEPNSQGQLPLARSIAMRRPNTSNLLLEFGARHDAYSATILKRPDVLRDLLQIDPMTANQLWAGAPLLHHAVASGDRALVEAVLAHVKDAAAPNNIGYSPLQSLPGKDSTEIAELLRARGISETVFDLVASRQHAALDRMLISNPTLANITNAFGRVPLRYALGLRDTIAVRLLLERGADPNQPWDGRRVHLVEPEAGQTNRATLLHAVVLLELNDLVQLFLDKGARLNAFEENGLTALGVALWRGNDDAVQVLLELGANPNAQISTNADIQTDGFPRQSKPPGFQPLHVAAHRGRTNAIGWLVARGARLEGTNFHGQTPLEMLLRPARDYGGLAPPGGGITPLGWTWGWPSAGYPRPSEPPYPKPGKPPSVMIQLLRNLGAKEPTPAAVSPPQPAILDPPLRPVEPHGR